MKFHHKIIQHRDGNIEVKSAYYASAHTIIPAAVASVDLRSGQSADDELLGTIEKQLLETAHPLQQASGELKI